ncbi:hypothetical protein DL93DRAFT_2029476, partial [Clavulina sp. PMI_390]
PGVSAYVRHARETLAAAHDAIIESRVNQTYYANKLRTDDPQYRVGDKVYVSTRNLNLPRSLITKLLPRFIGPYVI